MKKNPFDQFLPEAPLCLHITPIGVTLLFHIVTLLPNSRFQTSKRKETQGSKENSFSKTSSKEPPEFPCTDGITPHKAARCHVARV